MDILGKFPENVPENPIQKPSSTRLLSYKNLLRAGILGKYRKTPENRLFVKVHPKYIVSEALVQEQYGNSQKLPLNLDADFLEQVNFSRSRYSPGTSGGGKQ
jgi:hypothetical protein